MVLLRGFAACLRKELKIHLTDVTHFIAMLFMPLVLIILLTEALHGTYSVAGQDRIPVVGDGASVERAIGSRLETVNVTSDELRGEVRDGRALVGVIVTGDQAIVIGDPAYPNAINGMYHLIDDHFSVEVRNPDDRPLAIDKSLSQFNYTIPGFTVMFLFFLSAFTGFALYGDVVNGAWLRLRTSQVPAVVMLLAKVVAAVIVGLLQLSFMFGIGWLFFGLEIRSGALLAIIVVGLLTSLAATTLGIMLTGLTRTARQMNQLNNLLLLLLGAVGGSLAPLASMPSVIQHMSIFTPHHYALEALRDVMFRGRGFTDTLDLLLPLAAFSAVFFTIGLLTLKYSKLSKVIY
jgi:ABC-type multidrug transport system permease subunit